MICFRVPLTDMHIAVQLHWGDGVLAWRKARHKTLEYRHHTIVGLSVDYVPEHKWACFWVEVPFLSVGITRSRP